MRNQRGFSLLELLIVVATLGILATIMIPMMRSALLRGHVASAAGDARIVHMAFKRYYIDNQSYPASSGTGSFDVATFEPLIDDGYYYYDDHIRGKMLDDEADGYGAPDDQGTDQEFWLEMTLKYDDSIRFVIADSNDAPLSGGDYVDGIAMFVNGTLKRLTSPVDHQ